MAVDLKTDRLVAEQLRTGWFGLVCELSDIGLQRRTWLDLTNQNPHWSYIEFVSSVPDHDQLLQARQEHWLTVFEFAVLDELRLVVDAYDPPGDDPYDNAAVLDDPAWHAVVEAAGHAKQRLLSMTADQREREMLLGGR